MSDAKITPERIRQEHAEIDDITAQLLKIFTERTAPPARICELLDRLYERAAAHLCDEETGIIHDAAKTDPELARRCEELCTEHEKINAGLDRLMALAQQGSCTHDWWDVLEREFHAFALLLNEHESDEQKLLDDMDT